MSNAALDLIVDACATYRITRLITKDAILRKPRAAIIRRAYGADDVVYLELNDVQWEQRAIGDDDAPKLAEFAICRWCVGAWCGFVVVALRDRRIPWTWERASRALVCASAAALIAGLEKP